MVQHWIYVHELNGTLTELVKFLTTEYRVLKQPLNPLASPYVYENEIKKDHKMDDSTNGIDKPSQKKHQWIKVPTRYDPYQK